MRKFIIISNTVNTSKLLSLNSLTGYGRIDVICRCINSAFFLSNNFRKNVTLMIFFLKNNKLLEIRGDKVRGINPDERAIAGVLKKVFQGTKYTGIRFYEESLENLIKKENPIMLGTKGEYSISKIQTQNTFLLGDQLGFQEDIYILLSNLEKYSLGSNIYLSSQAITIINYLLDQNS
ncbi:MAG: hypothetical protein ACW97X_02210 [Candidatus Hodarchaeales archaeon]